MIASGHRNGSAVDSMVMEINCYKLSENRSFRDAAAPALEAVLDIAFAPGAAKAAVVNTLKQQVTRWQPLLAKLLGFGNVDDEVFSLNALEKLIPKKEDHRRALLATPDVYAVTLQLMYQADVLSGEGILEWGQNTDHALAKSTQILQLLEFLDASDDDDSEDEDESD